MTPHNFISRRNATHHTLSSLLASAVVLGACLAMPASLHAQSTFGSIRGASVDASGASLPGTSIVLHSDDENTDRTVTADASGTFLFENVKPGHFSLRGGLPGFSTTNIKGIQLDARQDLRLTLTLAVAANATVVEVDASPDQLNTENAAISDSKDNQLITQLPLNNRATTTSPLGALTLSPNVQQDSQGNIALGGSSGSEVNFSVDGISTVNVRQNGPLNDAYPSQEDIAAVKITAFNNSAEFSQVGDVTFTTKSGSNKYHGSLLEYFQNSVLDASPYGFNGKAQRTSTPSAAPSPARSPSPISTRARTARSSFSTMKAIAAPSQLTSSTWSPPPPSATAISPVCLTQVDPTAARTRRPFR